MANYAEDRAGGALNSWPSVYTKKITTNKNKTPIYETKNSLIHSYEHQVFDYNILSLYRIIVINIIILFCRSLEKKDLMPNESINHLFIVWTGSLKWTIQTNWLTKIIQIFPANMRKSTTAFMTSVCSTVRLRMQYKAM